MQSCGVETVVTALVALVALVIEQKHKLLEPQRMQTANMLSNFSNKSVSASFYLRGSRLVRLRSDS